MQWIFFRILHKLKQAKKDGQFKISRSKIKKWLQNQQSLMFLRHELQTFQYFSFSFCIPLAFLLHHSELNKITY